MSIFATGEYSKLIRIMEDILGMKREVTTKVVKSKFIKQGTQMEQKEDIGPPRQRRMTPVPNDDIQDLVARSSKEAKEKYLSVEEEDEDDLECYDKEIDYVNPDLLSCEKNKLNKRKSWHGENTAHNDAWKKRHKLELSKSHSLDSGIDVRRRSRRKNNTTLFPSYLAKGQDRKQELLSISTISEDSEEELPIWMRKASLEEKKDVSEIRGATDEPMRLKFGSINKTNESLSNKFTFGEIRKNQAEERELKERQHYSDRRKELRRQKALSEKQKHRKITPSRHDIQKLRKTYRCSSNSFENISIEEADED